MNDSLPVETSIDSESTSSNDSGDANFDPDLYEEDRVWMRLLLINDLDIDYYFCL